MLKTLLLFVVLCGAVHGADLGDNLCPANQATHTAVKVEGSWQDPATWNTGSVPGTGARVCIPCNHFITNHAETADLQWIRCEGVLKVCDHCDTKISVHTLYIPMHGKCFLGMPEMPAKGKTVLEFVSGSAVGLAGDYLPGDTDKVSLGLICHGEFMACGTEKTGWLVLAETAEAGATEIVPVDLSYEWKVGDTILIAGTDSLVGETRVNYQSEYRTITGFEGRAIKFSEPLSYRHFPWRSDLRYHVANLSRNVVIRSRDPLDIDNRGHLMFMSSMNDIRYTLEEGLGRTDKSQPVTDPRKDSNGNLIPGTDLNPRGRYADHVHKAGPLGPAAIRKWVVVRGSPGWGMVNHASNCDWDNCIAIECFGAGFVTEEGQERGNIRRCIGAMNRGQGDYIHSTDDDHGRPLAADWGADGAGFWLQGGLVDVVDCVAFDNSGRGFALFNRASNGFPNYGTGNPIPAHLRFPILHDVSLLGPEYANLQHVNSPHAPSSTVPQRRFDSNTAYGNKVGLQGWSGPTHNDSGQLIWPLAVRGSITNLTLWGRGGKLHLEYMRQVNVDGLTIVGDRGFRPVWNSLSRLSEAVLLRSPEVTVRNWSIEGFDGVAAKFHVEGRNDPGGIAGKSIVIEGATINPDGSVN